MQHRGGAKIRSVVPRDYKRDEVREYRLYDSSSQGLVLYLPRAQRAIGEFWPISGSVFGASTKNRSSLEASLGFAAITGTQRIENGGTFAVDFADGRRNRDNFYVRRHNS